MPPADEKYDLIMRDASEHIFLVAVRRAIDTRLIAIEFDAGRGPGPHQEHVLTISVRDSDIAITADGIPHEWLPVSTGFIDIRFSRLVDAVLTDLQKKALETSRFL